MSKKQQNIKYYGRPTKEVRETFVVTDENVNSELQRMKEHLDSKLSRGVRVSTLHEKYVEILNKFTLKDIPYLNSLKGKVWSPVGEYVKGQKVLSYSSFENIVKELNPVVVWAQSKQDVTEWIHIRQMISNQRYSSGQGRNLKFYVKDSITNKVLGLIEMTSDTTAMDVRDNFFGWTKENRKFKISSNGKGEDKQKLEQIQNCATLIAVQPFGNLFLGGKLISVLATSDVVRNAYFERYGTHILSCVTTSLYGEKGGTQYNGLNPIWRKRKTTTGKTNIVPDDNMYFPWKYYMERLGIISKKGGSGPKQTFMSKLNRLFLKQKSNHYNHGHKRGYFVSVFYKETKELLCTNCDVPTVDNLTPTFGFTQEELVKFWKDKVLSWSKRKYTREQGKNPIISVRSIEFYSDILHMGWIRTVQKHGRLNPPMAGVPSIETSREVVLSEWGLLELISFGWLRLLMSCIYWDSYL